MGGNNIKKEYKYTLDPWDEFDLWWKQRVIEFKMEMYDEYGLFESDVISYRFVKARNIYLQHKYIEEKIVKLMGVPKEYMGYSKLKGE